MRRLYQLLIFVLILTGSTANAQSLIHYWNFNTSTDETALLTASFTIGGATLTRVNGATSFVQTTSNTSNGFETLNENARNGDAASTHLRYTNSIDGTLIFALPTTGYENAVVKYTTRRSSAANGAGIQVIDYSTDGINFTNLTSITTNPDGPALQTFDFSAIPATDNNANFKVRITFQQGAGGITGNNRFDNFTMDGTAIGGDTNPPSVAFSPLNNATAVATNVNPTLTFNEDIRLINNSAIDNVNVDGLIELKIDGAAGTSIPFDATINGRVITIVPTNALANGQLTYVALKANVVEDMSDNAVVNVQSSLFTIIPQQTSFQPGDIVFVAYRANSTTASDEIQFLTFVDILPGTQINFTDAKFTDNAQSQCPGGFVWTAPVGGIPAMTAVSIRVDSPFDASKGSVAGASFGLSSGGEQVIVYTGSAASPQYITAISTNAWVTGNHTICNGSLSKLPGGLADGQTSINLSTAPGNVSANTVNAFYNGVQTGTPANLRAAILNPANWVGVGSATPAQQWPSWGPVVTAALATSQTTIDLTFGVVMDNATATTLANFTGIAGLQSAVLSADGKKITLTFANAFTPAASYTLNVSNLKDTQNRFMDTYAFTFTYSTSVSFDKKFISVAESAGEVLIKLKIQNPSTSSVNLVVKGAPYNTASSEDFTLATSTTLNFTGTTPNEHVVRIPITTDQAPEQDEYFVLSLESPTGAAITGSPYMTVFIKDSAPRAPLGTKTVELSHVGSFAPVEGESTTEIVVHDPGTQRLFIISSIEDRLDIADFSNPANIKLIKSVDMTQYGGITSVAVHGTTVATASPNANDQLEGSVVFFNTNGEYLNKVTVGVLPDMVTFSPDGTKVMTANEGQPNDAYSSDPEGSVSIIDVSGGIANLDQSKATTLLFTAFNSEEATLIAAGVRKLKTTSTLSQDFEPEYITISRNGLKAWVTLQENNAIAEINIETKSITSIWPLGKKDHSLAQNGLDASDNSGVVEIANWPVKSFYLPDGIAGFIVDNVQYLVTANEGDEKEYSGLNERTTVGAVTLDATAFPNAAVLKEDHNIGRLRMSKLSGDTDGDGDYDEINIPGGRSFTIWNATTKEKVFDSGDQFERITSEDPATSGIFNADNESNGFKSRSRAKGPEPEGITVATLGTSTYAFIALERVGGVMVYDITVPSAPKFVDYKGSRSNTTYSGDQGPEGIIYISREKSPDGRAYIAVANEISGTISVYEIQKAPKMLQAITFTEIPNKVAGDAAFALAATSTSGLPVEFTTTDDEVTITNQTVTIVKAGKVTLNAAQAGDDKFAPATEVKRDFCINPVKPVITMQNASTSTASLVSSATEGNQWYKDGTIVTGATSSTLSISSAGVYTVKSTIQTCSSALSNEFPVVITGDLAYGHTRLGIYPNPANSNVVIELPGQGLKSIRILSTTGVAVAESTSSESEMTFSLDDWSTGMYIVRVSTATGDYHGRFIKK
jgi:Bacterial Ig-like domain/Secretion system C-terminal sorting domain